jgi:uncharacterized protein (TIGR02118 family)
VSHGPAATPSGASGYHLVALLQYDNLTAIQNAFASPEGQTTVADVLDFATGGADLIMFDTHEV